ncbi:MAG: ATP-binding cassette domain-containing protein [Chloroflexota bacterium]
MSEQPLLKVENLSLERDGRTILREVNLDVYPGQIHALLGVNGSGKSSLAYALMGCSGYRPDAGRIWLDGENVTDLPIDERGRRGMTMAWQEPARFEGLPVSAYLSLGPQKADRDRVEAALHAVNLAPRTYGRRHVDTTLSGGERKRVELAAVYARRPRLAILDEPDSGIDALSLDDIRRLLRRMAESGMAVLLITHREDMTAVADVASIMCLGSVIFSGDPAEAEQFYHHRCQPHAEALGAQPWQTITPQKEQI